jgi:hypothetical protein
MRPIVLGATLLGWVLALPAGALRAQDVDPRAYCVSRVTPTIRGLFEQGDRQALGRLAGDTASRATSFLAPSGVPPAAPPAGANRAARRRYERAAMDWRCQYAASKVADADSTTAWCEGTPGDGVGEIVVFQTSAEAGPPVLEIWAGYGKSESVFRSNARPRQVRVWALRFEVDVEMEDGPGKVEFASPRPVGSRVVELRDLDGWQPLPFPDLRGGPSSDAGLLDLLVGVEIRSVYPGARFTDTCVSEIRASSDHR